MLPQLLAVASAGAKIYGGISAYQSSQDQADALRDQGETIKEEAYVDAARIRDEGYRFAQNQVMAFISSGVEMQGTPLLLSNETISLSQFEGERTERRGDAALELANINAKITERTGKAQLISSITGAASGLGKDLKNA